MDFAQAVDDNSVISFTYDGLPRVVQPATYGTTSTGKLSLRGCLIDGQSRTNGIPCWELYTVAKIVNVTHSGEYFADFALSGYTKGDSVFVSIIAEH